MSNPVACINMIKQQLRTNNVEDDRIIDLFIEISRAKFVPEAYRDFAYADFQIPLAHDQRMMTPLEEALLLQSLGLTGQELILEIGTGSGFLTTLLSRLARKVVSVDYFSEFTAKAQPLLKQYDCHNVELITADGHQGYLDAAPYDVVILTGSIERLTETHRLQVLPGGKLFALIGRTPVVQGQLHHLDHSGEWREELLFETDLPPLIDKSKHGDFIF